MQQSTTEIAVSCHAVTKTYGEGRTRVEALRGVDMEVRCGELMMLVGPSGSGKTTLISVVAGILDRSAGECLVFGQDLDRMNEKQRTRFRGSNIGFVFQAFNLIPTLSSLENVSVPLILNGTSRREAIDRSRELLRRVGFDDRMMGSSPSALSGGQQQRIVIARAIVHRPRLVVCDEPTSSLDHETGLLVMEMLRAVVLDGERALVVVTHDARIFGYADRIARMSDGRIESVEVAPPPPPASSSPLGDSPGADR